MRVRDSIRRCRYDYDGEINRGVTPFGISQCWYGVFTLDADVDVQRLTLLQINGCFHLYFEYLLTTLTVGVDCCLMLEKGFGLFAA